MWGQYLKRNLIARYGADIRLLICLGDFAVQAAWPNARRLHGLLCRSSAVVRNGASRAQMADRYRRHDKDNDVAAATAFNIRGIKFSPETDSLLEVVRHELAESANSNGRLRS
jgi:hypothetical protein